MSVISRTDRGLLADWWWTVDRWLLTTILLLMGYGVLLCLAASPPVAQRLNLGEFHFFTRQLLYMILAFGLLVAASFLTISQVRRVSFVLAVLGFALLVSTLFIGPVIKGATRWIDVGPVSVQPSEILKPVFVVLSAWLFAESMKRPDMPGTALSAMFFVGFAGILILQPDYGQTVLITAVWGLMLFLTGISWRWIGGFLMAAAAIGMGIAYSLVPHVADRINRFIDRDSGDTFQVDAALSSFAKGGLLGQGPGEGTVKRILPDAHSDFIFAVAGEELGMVACVLLLGAVCLHRASNPPTHSDPARSVRPARHHRACGTDRIPGDHQHVGQPVPSAGQRHDLAVRFLRRLVARVGRACHGARARLDQTASGGHDIRAAVGRPAGGGLHVMGGQGSESRPIVIAAGGTGGHLFPAQALAQELKSRGHVTHLMTDSRVDQLAGAFPGEEVHQIPSATFGLRKPLRIPPAVIKLYRGYRLARRIMKRCNVRAAVGFGGYPTLPPMFAATRLGLPACLHEQNAVIGRANRLLASRVDMIAGAFPSPGHLSADLAGRYRVTGNPVRQVAKACAASPYDTPAPGGEFRLLVFGGSQGARVMSDIVPAAVAAMTDRSGLRIVQQCREEDMERVGKLYGELGVDVEIAPFFKDLPQKIAASHLVVCRSGASTVAELVCDRATGDHGAAAAFAG